MPSLGPQQGEELGGGGGGPPAWPSPVTPTLMECEEEEERGTQSLQKQRVENEMWDHGTHFFPIQQPSSSPHTTDFMSNRNV